MNQSSSIFSKLQGINFLFFFFFFCNGLEQWIKQQKKIIPSHFPLFLADFIKVLLHKCDEQDIDAADLMYLEQQIIEIEKEFLQEKTIWELRYEAVRLYNTARSACNPSNAHGILQLRFIACRMLMVADKQTVNILNCSEVTPPLSFSFSFNLLLFIIYLNYD